MDNTHMKILVESQLGNTKTVYELFQKPAISNNDKAFAFAILKERDSLYAYLKQNINAGWVNSRREFDPYRKEARYIEFMKKNHLPLIEKYNGVTE